MKLILPDSLPMKFTPRVEYALSVYAMKIRLTKSLAALMGTAQNKLAFHVDENYLKITINPEGFAVDSNISDHYIKSRQLCGEILRAFNAVGRLKFHVSKEEEGVFICKAIVIQ